MTLHGSLFFLFITIIWCHTISANSTSTNLETCSCNLNTGVCDALCCCDVDCSTEDIKRFNCDSISNAAVNSRSSTSSVQSTCFKDVPIYRSNAPYIVQKKGDLVCVDHERDTDMENANYQRLLNLKIDTTASARSLDVDNSNLSPLGSVVNLTVYQAGTSVFRYMPTSNTSSYYSLPINAFNSVTCAGSRPITYMNNFTSTCYQPVNQQTCLSALDTTKYINSFCLVTNPMSLAAGSPIYICCNASGSSSSWTSTCLNPLQTLTLTIFYLNPTGIVSCSVSLTTATGTSNTLVQQTFTVSFVQSGSSASSVPRSGNPGYLQGAPIIAGTANGSSIITSSFTVLQASTSGDCTGTNPSLVRFGQNIQSTCLFSPSAAGSCPSIANTSNIFMPFSSFNVYVAAYGDPLTSDISDYWLPVTFCTSEIGSSTAPVCQTGSVTTPSANQCYIRADIQIVYANIGSVINPQPVLGAVVFHYQSVTITTTSTLSTPFVVTQTVTFQDVSNAPPTDDGRLSRPNTRLPGDFFYPFSLNRATNSISLSSTFCLIILFIFILI